MSIIEIGEELKTIAGREGSLLLGDGKKEEIKRLIYYLVDVDHDSNLDYINCSECGNACEYRCSETHHRKPCLFFCNKCCKTSLCVPSGTYGHKEECPCYITIGIPRKENPSSLN
ncbi:Protein RSI-1 [Glycine soja]